MSLLFFYDTETTGLPVYKDPSDAPHQPHIVQAAAMVADADTRKVIASVDLIVRPDGWTIPDEVAQVHGITTERAMQVGIDESLVVEILLNMWRATQTRIAHNQQFDARIMRIALKRFATDAVAEEWAEGDAACTCQLARPIVELPKNKLPNLGEAYEFFTGNKLQDAHTALADTRACAEIYWHIQDRN